MITCCSHVSCMQKKNTNNNRNISIKMKEKKKNTANHKMAHEGVVVILPGRF